MLNLDVIRERMWMPRSADIVALIEEIEQLRLQIRAHEVAIERWRQTASAAADEIEEHWAAYCDEENAGPVSLVRRLRTTPATYGLDPESTRMEGRKEERKYIIGLLVAALATADNKAAIAGIRALLADLQGTHARRSTDE